MGSISRRQVACLRPHSPRERIKAVSSASDSLDLSTYPGALCSGSQGTASRKASLALGDPRLPTLALLRAWTQDHASLTTPFLIWHLQVPVPVCPAQQRRARDRVEGQAGLWAWAWGRLPTLQSKQAAIPALPVSSLSDIGSSNFSGEKGLWLFLSWEREGLFQLEKAQSAQVTCANIILYNM